MGVEQTEVRSCAAEPKLDNFLGLTNTRYGELVENGSCGETMMLQLAVD